MTTPFQPTLPIETSLTEPELNYIEESPKGLYPENQDSNYGLLRSIFTTRVVELVGQQETIYNERFVDTVSDFMDEWEKELGLPTAPSGATLATRRQIVKSRLIKSPFTKQRRKDILENFIVATFGDPVAFSPSGVALSSAGVPLYSESAPLETLYSIRENMPYGRNLLANGGFEIDIAGWSGDTSVTGLARSTANSKFGLASMTAISASANPYFYTGALFPAASGQILTASAWVYSPTRSLTSYVVFQWFDGSSVQIGANVSSGPRVITTAGRWTLVEFTAQAPVGAAFVRPVYQFANSVAGDVLYFDGAQLEITPSTARGKNLLRAGSSFDSVGALSFWGVTAGTTITQTTAQAHDSIGSGLVTFPASAGYINAGAPISGKTKGRTFTLSAWLFATGTAIGKTARLQFNEVGGDFAEEGVIATDVVLVSGWQRVTATGTINRDDRTLLNIYVVNVFSVGFAFNIDSVQIEEASVATVYEEPKNASSFVNTQRTPFYYEIRIKNTVTPDMVGLVRELTRITPSGITFDVFSTPDV